MDNLMSQEERVAKHRRWLESWGLSQRDWQRIRLAADEVTPTHTPHALVDLSVPARVVVWFAANPHPPAGTLLGVVPGPAGPVSVIAWRMTERELGTWSKTTGRA